MEWKSNISRFEKIYRPYITAMNVQLAILQNQHSGKDTHIRQVKIFGPREYFILNLVSFRKATSGVCFPDFKSADALQYNYIR
jgi:anaphase-promoting complex subunit 10